MPQVGRLKIGSNFLKIGSQFLRIGPNNCDIRYGDANAMSAAFATPLDIELAVVEADFPSVPTTFIVALYLDVGSSPSITYNSGTGTETLELQNGKHYIWVIRNATFSGGEFFITVTANAGATVSGGAQLWGVFGGDTVVQTGSPSFGSALTDGNKGFAFYGEQAPSSSPANGWHPTADSIHAGTVGMADVSGGGTFSSPGGDLWCTTIFENPSGPANAVGISIELNC